MEATEPHGIASFFSTKSEIAGSAPKATPFSKRCLARH